jgi:hypothetical protein
MLRIVLSMPSLLLLRDERMKKNDVDHRHLLSSRLLRPMPKKSCLSLSLSLVLFLLCSVPENVDPRMRWTSEYVACLINFISLPALFATRCSNSTENN